MTHEQKNILSVRDMERMETYIIVFGEGNTRESGRFVRT